MRIAVTSDPFIPVPPVNYGGIERIIHFLIEGLAKRGHEVVLVAHADSRSSVPLIPYPPLKSGLSGHLNHVLTIRKLKAWRPQVIHSFSRLAYLLPFLGSKVLKLMSYQREPTLAQVKKAVRFSRRNTLSFTGCSNYISNQISPFAPAYTVYNGVDLSLYQFQPVVSEDAPLVFLGRIEPNKGTHLAIEAAQKANRKLVIAGNIPAEHTTYFDAQVKPFLGERIQYIGPVNDAQKNTLLGSALAFLMPIEWNEPFGIVMAEALACGTPVIGFKRGSVAEVVRQGVNGFACHTMEEMVTYIQKVAQIDRRIARQDAELRFSADVIVESYVQLYDQLIKQTHEMRVS